MKYYAFQTESLLTPKGDYLVGLEKVSDMVEELRALHEQHYAETETLYLNVPFKPDYDRYKETEARGQFVVFTARTVQGQMIGYLQYYVFRDMHASDHYQAREDAFFVTPEHRGSGVAPALLRYAEDALKQLGCRYVGMSSKAPAGGPDIGSFLERKGYRPVATYYVKELEPHAQAPRTTTT